jgi:hypothetical protein
VTTEENYSAPAPPPDGSPGSAPGVTPIPDHVMPSGMETDKPVETDGATVHVRVECGQSLVGFGILRALSIMDLPDNAEVRDRIESGFLKIVD